MPCPTCGCTCCDRILTLGHEALFIPADLVGDRRFMMIDVASIEDDRDYPHRAEMLDAIESLKTASLKPDQKEFHQRLNRKPLEKR